MFAKGFTPDHGGIESYSESVAVAWAELGFHVTVITQFDGAVGAEQRQQVTVINVGPGSQIQVFWRMWKAARRFRKSIRPNLVHATTWRVAIPALLVFRDAPTAITIHGREVTEMRGWLSWLMKRVVARTERVLVISRSTLEQCLAMLPGLGEKAIVSWNGLSHVAEAERQPKVWNKSPGQSCRLYSLCRLVPRKNIAGALEALAFVRANGVEAWEYCVGGDGEERGKLEALATKLGIGDKVHFLGKVAEKDIGRLYREADLFIHPQTAGPDGRDIEGFGLSIVDAMSFGTPVLAGRDGAPGEYLIDGETAYLVDGNDVRGLATRLQNLIGRFDELRKTGSRGRLWALRTLTWKEHVQRLWTDMTDDHRIGRM